MGRQGGEDTIRSEWQHAVLEKYRTVAQQWDDHEGISAVLVPRVGEKLQTRKRAMPEIPTPKGKKLQRTK